MKKEIDHTLSDLETLHELYVIHFNKKCTLGTKQVVKIKLRKNCIWSES